MFFPFFPIAHYYYYYSSDRINAAWTNCLISSSTPVESALLTPATRAFIPRIESAVAKMLVFTNVNLAVHTAIYNHLIATAVASEQNNNNIIT